MDINNTEISDELLASFIDGNATKAETEYLIDAINSTPEIQEIQEIVSDVIELDNLDFFDQVDNLDYSDISR